VCRRWATHTIPRSPASRLTTSIRDGAQTKTTAGVTPMSAVRQSVRLSVSELSLVAACRVHCRLTPVSPRICRRPHSADMHYLFVLQTANTNLRRQGTCFLFTVHHWPVDASSILKFSRNRGVEYKGNGTCRKTGGHSSLTQLQLCGVKIRACSHKMLLWQKQKVEILQRLKNRNT